MRGLLERFFKLTQNNTTPRVEIIGGVTTFMTMAYIIVVNPNILSVAGLDKGAVMVATCLASSLATLTMAFLANYPIALAPGMGINAYFTYSVCLKMGISWQVALGAVFISGIMFILLTLSRAREAVINAVPINLKRAVSVGIGLFIALIGFQQAGIIVADKVTMITLGNLSQPKVILSLLGLLITTLLWVKKIKGAILLGILITAFIGLFPPFRVTPCPQGIGDIIGLPPSLGPTFFKLDIIGALKLGLVAIIFTFFLIDFFDTAGTLIGISHRAGFLTREGKLPRANRALFSDAVGTSLGALLGTSTVTSYIESASGVAEGARTGLSAVVTAGLFLVALFFSPLLKIIPPVATAPALIIVGLLMMEAVKEIDFKDFTEALPCFLVITLIALAYNITVGLAIGFLSYIIIKILVGKAKTLHPMIYFLGACFFLYFIFKFK
jgi:AGZA family xanthine/uracil permease-like MFS transporter